MDQQDIANAVRGGHSAEVFIFPESEIIRRRPRADQVVVTHAGETDVYDSPEALYAAFRQLDPEYRKLIETGHAFLDKAEALTYRANANLAAAKLRRAEVDRLLSTIAADALVAMAFAGILLMAST